MIYVIKAAITLALLYSCFFVFLSKETFHRFNRCMLVGIMLVSLVMPMFHFTTSHPTTLNEEVYIVQNYIEQDYTPIVVAPQAPRITWIQVLTWIYLIGVAVMLILTIVQAIALTRFLRCGVRHTDSRGNTVILHNGEVPPFSIFRYIVMSVKDYETSRQYILTHEQEHIRLAHTYDLLLLQGMKILQWFNPFIWFLSRDLKAVHEYEADQAVINQGIDAKSYQQLLVMKVVGNRLQPFTNNLNHGSLKKRIIMMYQKPSNRWLMLKALCAIPVAALTINTFATPIETDPVEDMVKTLETTSVPTINEVKENVLTTVESVDETTFAIHPVADQYGRITGFTHEGKPADGYFECTAEYVFINGRQATEAELRNYKTLLANSTFEMVKTENGTAKYNYKDKHGIIVIHTQGESATPDDDNPLILVNGLEMGLPADIKTLDGETISKMLGIKEEDVESITVLKDAAAKALYGERGKNGVIEIKVKSSLLDKLPGIQKNEDGTYSINGRKVQKILVNGKEFFKALSDDPETRVFGHEETPPTITGFINGDDPIFDVTEEPAQYPGGQGALMQYLAQHLRYPKISQEHGAQGRALVQFVIEKDGSLSNIKIFKGALSAEDAITVSAQGTAAEGNKTPKEAYDALNIEAVRVIREMPNWIPAKQQGEAVRMKYTLPINFRLQ
jgi:TonB-dependent SusC/RagA subfamily outer membrane receptor